MFGGGEIALKNGTQLIAHCIGYGPDGEPNFELANTKTPVEMFSCGLYCGDRKLTGVAHPHGIVVFRDQNGWEVLKMRRRFELPGLRVEVVLGAVGLEVRLTRAQFLS